ncbi:MAG: Preprotein translocase secY subunit [Labilithrix sp.]|nr:Preprotein translocase secY subunit [Labilithrix sp.]
MRSPAIRLAITLLLPLLVVLGGEHVLLPGMEDLCHQLTRSGSDFLRFDQSNLSVFALGIAPVMTAYGLVELAAFLVPRWARLRHGNPEGRAKLERTARVVAIVLAALQGWGVAQSLSALRTSDVFGIVADLPSPLIVVATLIGGVCVQIVVAQLISRQGIANGYVLLTVVEALAGLRGTFVPRLERARLLGTLETRHVALMVAVVALPAAATWLALRGGDRTRAPADPVSKTKNASAAPYRAARALAVSPWVPVPSSSISPYPVALAVVGLPATLALVLHLGRGTLDATNALYERLPYTVAVAVLTLVVAFVFARLLHRPQEMTEVATRVGLAGGEEQTDVARAALRATALPTLLFFATLIAAATASSALPAGPSVIFVPLLVAVVMDATTSLRTSSLVPVWQERRASAVPVVRAVLAAEGIESSVRGLGVLSLLQAFAPYAPAEIVVAEVDAARATSVLRHVFLGERRDLEGERGGEPIADGDAPAAWTPARRVLGLASTTLFALVAVVSATVAPHRELVAKEARGRLEVVRVADDEDVFGRMDDKDVPEGIELRFENVPLGQGHMQRVYFARVEIREREPYSSAAARLRRWTDTIALPAGTQIALAPVDEIDEDTLKSRRVGIRTFIVRGSPIITTEDVVEAMPSINTMNGTREVYVAVTLSEAASEKFRLATREYVQRRIAIVVDGQIDSAPVVRTEIGGGRLSITMGAGDPDVQLVQAKALAKSLGGSQR